MVKKDRFLLWIIRLVIRFIACKSEVQEFYPHCSLKIACEKFVFTFESVKAEAGGKKPQESAEGGILTLLLVFKPQGNKNLP